MNVLNFDESSERCGLWKIEEHLAAKPRKGALPKLPLVELQILRGQARQKVRLVQVPVFLIGTALDCDLVLRDPRVPEVHTYLYVTREAITIRHMGAAPNLFVRNQKVEVAKLQHGDRVQIGDAFEFQLKIQTPAWGPSHEPPRILRLDAAERMSRHAGVSNRQVLLSPG